MQTLKNKIPKPLKNAIKTVFQITKRIAWLLKRKMKRVVRHFVQASYKDVYSFAILCVKKSVYVDMAIDNINSLHYLNPNHTVTIYCDTICFEYLSKRKNYFDYKEKVTFRKIENDFKISEKPWQYNKIETLIEASKNDQILTDADGIWHNDPVVDKGKITLLVIVNKIKDKPLELDLAQKIIAGNSVTEFNHYVSGFVSLPSKFLNFKLENELRLFNDKIQSTATNDELRRLSEELSVSLAIQNNYRQKDIAVLKNEDGPGDKKSLESFYYGCLNQINK